MSDQRPDEDRGAHRPQVIDLDAEEIRTEAAPDSEAAEKPAEQPTPPPPHHAEKRGRGAATWIIAALILGALGGGWLYRDVLSSYLPSNEMKALKAQVAALEVNNTDLAQQVATAQQAADAAAAAAATAGQEVRRFRRERSRHPARRAGPAPRHGRIGPRHRECRSRRLPQIALNRPRRAGWHGPAHRQRGACRPRPAHRRAGEGRGEPQVARRSNRWE